ncbi:hypothetical protein ACROYT_G014783 [Oculina patagonica]
MDAEDIKYEMGELTVEDRIYLRNFLCEIRKQEECITEVVQVLSDSSSSKRKNKPTSSSSESGSTLSVYSSDDSSYSPQSQTPKQTQRHDYGRLEKYKPLDLPPDFDLLTSFPKKVEKALKSGFKQPGSLPHDLLRKFVNQVADHIESENSHPSKQTIEWVAWRYCVKYPCLQQINPLGMIPGEKPWKSKPFKEWSRTNAWALGTSHPGPKRPEASSRIKSSDFKSICEFRSA